MSVARVSVILTTYRRQGVLPRAIESVVRQTLQDWELLVVDDEPSAETEAIVRGFGDPRIRYLAHEENRGLCAARNTGIEAARGAYVAFLDDDDVYLPRKLEVQAGLMDALPESVGVVSCFEAVEQGDGTTVERGIRLDGDVHPLLVRDDLIRMQPLLIRRECFVRVGLFDPRLRMHDDYDMTLRLSRHHHFRTVPEALVRITATPGSMSTNTRHRIAAIETLLATHPELGEDGAIRARWERRLARHHGELGQVSEWRRYMGRSLRAHPGDLRTWLAFGAGLLLGPGAHLRLARWRGERAAAARREAHARG